MSINYSLCVIKGEGEVLMEEWGNFISNIGFPVFITIYLLVRLEKIINKMMDSLEELKELLRKK